MLIRTGYIPIEKIFYKKVSGRLIFMTETYYNDNFKEFTGSTLNLDLSELYSRYIKYLKHGARILDMGCGPGRDLLFFKQNGFSVSGIDNAGKFVNFAREYSGCSVSLMDFREVSFSEEFEGIWACASLLHLNKDELQNVLERSVKALKPEGVFYMSFKYGSFEGIRNGRYFLFLDENAFRKIIKDINNISILEMWKTPDLRENRNNEYWLNVIVKKTS